MIMHKNDASLVAQLIHLPLLILHEFVYLIVLAHYLEIKSLEYASLIAQYQPFIKYMEIIEDAYKSAIPTIMQIIIGYVSKPQTVHILHSHTMEMIVQAFVF